MSDLNWCWATVRPNKNFLPVLFDSKIISPCRFKNFAKFPRNGEKIFNHTTYIRPWIVNSRDVFVRERERERERVEKCTRNFSYLIRQTRVCTYHRIPRNFIEHRPSCPSCDIVIFNCALYYACLCIWRVQLLLARTEKCFLSYLLFQDPGVLLLLFPDDNGADVLLRFSLPR